MQTNANPAVTAFDPSSIKVLSWNVQKQYHRSWADEFLDISSEVNLSLLQEVRLDPAFQSVFDPFTCKRFAPGFSYAKNVTGVLTLAQAHATDHTDFSDKEPFLRTLKKTNITRYNLTGSKQTLLVINLHAVNFSLGMNSYRAQLIKLNALLAEHTGPVILAGDFNTWHTGRYRYLKSIAQFHELQEIEFAEDHRSKIFGMPLDYFFVRQLSVKNATTKKLLSSDHNPLLAEFSCINIV